MIDPDIFTFLLTIVSLIFLNFSSKILGGKLRVINWVGAFVMMAGFVMTIKDLIYGSTFDYLVGSCLVFLIGFSLWWFPKTKKKEEKKV